MISCNVIQDLLLMYTADECSEDSRQLIEEHLKTCKNCQDALEALNAPVLPPEDMEVQRSLEEKAKDFNAAKGFRKIHRRWLASLLCVFMIFPLIGTGFLVRNQLRGEGISFANLHEIYATHAFLKAVQARDYNKAFRYLDVKRMYGYMTNGQVENLYDWDSEYTLVEIGNRSWYVNREVYLNNYQSYLNTGDETAFWEAMMIFNSEHRSYTTIPEDQFDAASSQFSKETGMPVSLAATDSDIDNYGYFYAAFTTKDGDVYYYPVAGDFTLDAGGALMIDSFCIPAAFYEENMVTIKQEYSRIQACAEYYKKLGLQAYTKSLKEKFLANMKKLESSGITIESFSVQNIVTGGNGAGEWQLDVGLVCLQDDNRSAPGGITVFAHNGFLFVSGGFYTSQNSILDTVMGLLTIGEDVDNYYD